MQYARAAADFTRAAELQPDDYTLWFRAAVLQARAGNREAYHRLCRGMLERFGATRNPMIAERTLRACLLLAGVSDDQKKLPALADLAVSTQANEKPTEWASVVRGLAEYRAGRFEQAAAWLDKIPPSSKYPALMASLGFVLAMTQQRAGREEAARASLEKARQIVSARLPVKSPGKNWANLFFMELLGREAETLLGGPRSSQAKQQEAKAKSP
jgi:tetratricopeptide (TPR) repeat protein